MFLVDFFIGTVIISIFVFIIVFITPFTQDFCFESLIYLFIVLILGVEFEYVESILDVDLIFQVDSMGDLIFFFHKIEFFFDSWIILVLVLSYLEQHLNHILRPLVNRVFVQNLAEAVKNKYCNLLAHFLKMLTDFSCQTYCNFDRVIRRLVEKKEKYLCCYHFGSNLLIT